MSDPHRHDRRGETLQPRGLVPRWELRVPGNVFAAPTVVAASHVVVSVRGPGRSGTVQAVDLLEGRTKWEHTLERGGSAPPVVWGETIIVTGEDGTVEALDASTGAVVWRTSVGGPVEGRPLVVDQAVVVPVGMLRRPAGPGAVVGLASSGRTRWTTAVGPAVVAGATRFDGGHVVIATAAGTVHTVDLDDGSMHRLVGPAASDHDEVDAAIVGSPVRAPVVRLVGLSVVMATTGTVLAVDDAGSHRWSWHSPAGILAADLASDGHHVFVPGSDGRLLALVGDTGVRSWCVERLGAQQAGVWSTPLIVGDAILSVCSTGELVAVGATTGHEIASAPVAGEPVGARLDADAAGRFLVATLGHARTVSCWELTR